MSPEDKSKIVSDQVWETFKSLTDEQRNVLVSGLVDLDIPSNLFTEIASRVDEQGLVVFVQSHQGYGEAEVLALISKEIDKRSEKFNGIYFPYSEPATDKNVGKQLALRQEYYQKCKLFMLPVIRETDRKHKIYSQNITVEMEENNRKSVYKLAHARKNHFAVVSCPEGTLQGGRINPETGKIFGLQPALDQTILNLIFKDKKNSSNSLKDNSTLVPLAINGSYRLLDSDKFKMSPQLFEHIKKGEKIITATAREQITASDLTGDCYSNVESLMYKVAEMLPPEAKGFYSQRRVNLSDI